jgi:hypothetical protein
MDGLETLREVETEWLANALNGFIANLGYPVGMGVGLHPKDAEKAASKLFDRYLKMIGMARDAALAKQKG